MRKLMRGEREMGDIEGWVQFCEEHRPVGGSLRGGDGPHVAELAPEDYETFNRLDQPKARQSSWPLPNLCLTSFGRPRSS